MIVPAKRHHFFIINLWDFFRRSRAPNSEGYDLIWPKFELVRGFMPVCLTKFYCKFDEDRIKTEGARVKTFFPVISQWALSVAMEISVLIGSVPNAYAAFPPPQ